MGGRNFRKKGNKGKKNVAGKPGSYNLDTIVKENQKLFDYYKQQDIIPENEWNAFIDNLKADLPVAFRIQQSLPEKDLLEKFLQENYIAPLAEDTPALAPTPIDYVPHAYQCNISRANLRSFPKLKKLHEFLVSETEIGNMSRQETVSMVPPLLLDVQPDHLVLDACASPGSKTTQIIEIMHKDNVDPPGVLVANDLNNSRCYLLVHQTLSRLPTANVAVVNHDAAQMPAIQDENGKPVLYDRILCDVICSGDGTFRKNYELWNSWTPQKGLNLHKVQQNIARRCIELLKVGGMMVYSTCSLNPIEDEAVVAHMLRTFKGCVELVDVSDKLPSLIRSPGHSTWKVFNTELQEYKNKEEAAGLKEIVPSMFPPTPEEAAEFNLQRSFRILPHSQNSGGFYVAVFRKTADVPLSDFSDLRPSYAKKRKLVKEDPFVFLNEQVEDVKGAMTTHFGFKEDFNYNNFLIRTTNVEKKKGVYYVNNGLKNILDNNADRFHIVNTGVTLMRKVSKVSPCEYRLAQDGMPYISQYITKRIITELTHTAIAQILLGYNGQHYCDFAALEASDQALFHGLEPGSVVLQFNLNGITKNVCAWMGKGSVTAFVQREEKAHLLCLMGEDASPLFDLATEKRKQKAEKGREKDLKKNNPEGGDQEIPEVKEEDNASAKEAEKWEKVEKEEVNVEEN